MPEYTVLTVVAVVGVALVEVAWLRTGLFRSRQYWLAVVIVAFFQVLVDGWLTKLTAPIVLYHPAQHLGLRFPWDIPVEDFGFGWAMVTLTLLTWVRLGRRGSTVTCGAASTPTIGRRRPPQPPMPLVTRSHA